MAQKKMNRQELLKYIRELRACVRLMLPALEEELAYSEDPMVCEDIEHDIYRVKSALRKRGWSQ